jgi:CelD/BcsL family acetyltransferase involved in cellulose biosynthesis
MSDDERCSAPNPHALPAAVAAAARHAAGIANLFATAADGGSAFWPMARWTIAPGLSALRSPVVTRYDINGGPMAADCGAHALAPRLLDEIARRAGPQVVVARSVIAEGPAWEAFAGLAAAGRISLTTLDGWERATLDRAAAPDAQSYLDAFLSASLRKQLRRKRRALEEGGALRLEIAAAPDAIPLAFDAFCDLEAAGWKGRAGTALRQDPAGLAYVSDALLAMAAEGGAFVVLLMQAERPIAAGFFLRIGGEVVFWKTTYDETLARNSPGVVFDVMLTEWLYAQPWFERLDSGHDDSVDPDTLIWKQRRRMANVVIDLRPGSWRGRAITALLRLRQLLRAWKNRRSA